MGSSSKAKSSKRKSSKIHSQPRKMKKVKKSRRSKSKKAIHRHDTSSDDSMSSQSISSASNHSHSLYSDSDSMRSVSFSSSSSEGTYRGRKKVSRVRSNLKNKRKRVRRRSSSSESSEDFSRKKKRKRSKKSADSKSRKKSRKYKPRRDVKSSCATSDSYGCSSFKEESGSFSKDSTVQKLRIKSRENKTGKRESCEERVETKRTHRSPSFSSYSRSRDQSYSVSRGEETFIGEGNSRRLRSVITFAEQAQKEEKISDRDSLKEEIIYDRDDYPSPRSNDSSHGGSKRDVTSRSPVTSGDKRQKENVEGEETCISNHRVTEATESRKNADDQNAHDPFLNECETNKYDKGSRTYSSPPDANLGVDDLEAILRQKALENLRKFRGGVQRNVKAPVNQKNKDDGDVNQSFSSKAEIVHRVLAKQDNTNVIDHAQMLDWSIRTTSGGEVSCPNKDIADRGNSGSEYGNAEQKAIHPSDRLALSGNPLKEDYTTKQAVVLESESWNSFFGEKASGMDSSLNQATVLQASPENKLTEDMESEGKIPPKTTHSTTSSIINNSEADINNASSSAIVEQASSEQSTSQGQGSNEQQTEAKDGSQFEQKTMSVMRGGEMVQVSYKVYIPKRAPALARRQLNR